MSLLRAIESAAIDSTVHSEPRLCASDLHVSLADRVHVERGGTQHASDAVREGEHASCTEVIPGPLLDELMSVRRASFNMRPAMSAP